MRLLSFCLFFILNSFVNGDRCPQGAVDYGDAAECLLPIKSYAQFPIAQQICGLVGGRVIQPQNYFENVLASSQIQQGLGGEPAFIGVIKGINGSWTYADGTNLVYQNWKAGYPLSNDTCAVLNGQDFSWYSAPCEQESPFICTFSDLRCPDGWVLNSKTASCYLFNDVDLNNPVIYNYSSAEMICRYMNGHLTSIHSSDEEHFLRNALATNWPGVDCGLLQAVIGLTCSSSRWSWYDGTAFDFDLTEGHCNIAWGIHNDTNCRTYLDKWDYWDSNHQFLRFICKKPIDSTQMKMMSLENLITLAKQGVLQEKLKLQFKKHN